MNFIKLIPLLLITLFSHQLHAQKTINLAPNESKVMANNGLWTVNATCTVQGANKAPSKVRVTVTKHNGSINGKNLSDGQSTLITVRDNSSFSVSADVGT
ncbi:MAG: hypothetical protein PSV35_04330, partial [bacterium]|nr:hypothetical protein [bacterium]